MRPLAHVRCFAGIVLSICCLMLGGCSATKPKTAKPDANDGHSSEGWKPYWMYLLPSPHPRMHVEVDAVEGSVPDEKALEKLKEFLLAHCNKPEGVDVVRSDVIASKAARGISARTLARKYMNGPPTTNSPAPAFMYVLFYNYRVCADFPVARAGERGSHLLLTRSASVAGPPNPYAEAWPYPAIYFNTGYFLGFAETETLVHEAGHLLGMTSRTNGADGMHCIDADCVMTARMRPHRWLLGKVHKRLCEQCLAELAERRSGQGPSNLRFAGRVLARSEEGYHVLCLPGRTALVVGKLSEADCHGFATAVGSEIASQRGNEQMRLDCVIRDEVLNDSGKLGELIDRIKADPYAMVRRMGPSLVLQGCSQRYRALGKYADAVEVLRQAVALDGKSGRSHAYLGWMLATCPDGSVRNGSEGISVAKKACELTKWKDRRSLDALAAAYAESGDFVRAVQYAEQALRTGNSSTKEQTAMRARLAMYRDSKPFRETAE